MNKLITSMVFALVLQLSATAQSFYDEDSVQTIRITFAQSNWDALLDAQKAGNEDYIMATSVSINGIVYDSVGVKYKGNSTYSANQVKNPFHIELDTYKDHEHDGYTDIKLSNVKNDPSYLREVLSYKILRNYMDAPLSNYANVYVNGTLLGLYSNSESVSKKFADKRFGSKNNTYVKCNPPAGAGPNSSDYPNLVYLGTDSASYYDAYELKSDFGWDELIDLCDTLTNHTTAIEEILDVDRALWMLAFDNVLVNLDSYIGAFSQNYYLYRGSDGRFLPVVWDLNESFGSFTMTGSGNLNGTTSAQQLSHLLHQNDASFPLISKLLTVPTYKKMYLAHVKTMLQDNFTNNGLYYTQAQALKNTINSHVLADPNKFYTYANFNANITTDVSSGGGPGGPPGGTKPGITNLMNGRYSYLMGLSDFTATEPSISAVAPSTTTPAVGDTITITATVANENSVLLRYRTKTGGVAFEKATMYDDGMHNDGAANDQVYGADIIVDGGFVEYYIYAENTTIGKFSPTNAEHEFYTIYAQAITLGDLVINEFMASNNSTVTDQDGEYDDWVELYNKGTQSLDISGYHLSDDGSDLTLFSFPNGTIIQPNSYLVVWADGDITQTGYHADFKISSNGETIYLTDTNVAILDSITFGVQVSDSTYGRYPNGTGSFVQMAPTFGTVNSLGSLPIGTVVINEFLASNSTTAQDQDGEYDDWIELYNNGTSAVDISGYKLTDDQTDFTAFSFPNGTILNAGDYIVVWADRDLSQTGYHADFGLSANGETLYLADSNLIIVDSIAFNSQTADISFGRFPNGTGSFQSMTPTIGAQNMVSVITTGDLVINEFLASNDVTQTDQDGEYDDWVELYNKGTQALDISGYKLTDDKTDFTVFSFPIGTMIQPDSFIVVWADGDVTQTGYHADFKISASGESIYLSDSSSTIIDSVQFGAQTTDVSYGRYPNGTGSFQTMSPTFGAQNVNTTGLFDNRIVKNEFSLYPNPAHESFTIELVDQFNETLDLQIFDLNGRVMMNTTLNTKVDINSSEWTPGIYFIRVGNSINKLVVR